MIPNTSGFHHIAIVSFHEILGFPSDSHHVLTGQSSQLLDLPHKLTCSTDYLTALRLRHHNLFILIISLDDQVFNPGTGHKKWALTCDERRRYPTTRFCIITNILGCRW